MKEKTLNTEVVLAVILGLVIMFGITLGSGTLTSGYHFVDDWEHLRFENVLNAGGNMLTLLEDYMDYQMNMRFRPLWVVERVLLTGVFGSEMLVWNIYKAIMGGITLAFLYLAARFLKCSKTWSALFSLLMIIGAHFTPWYRETNQENTGLLIFSCAFVLLALQYYRGYKKSVMLDVVLAILIILCGLCKESFTLMMPVLISLRIGFEYFYFQERDKIFNIVKRKWAFLLATIIPFLVDVYIIIFWVGTDKTGYAGFDANTGITEYLVGIKTSLFVYQKWYIMCGFALVAISLIGTWIYKKKDAKKYLFVCILAIYVLGTQLVAHAKGVMYHRYTIPAIFGYMLPFVIGAYHCLKGEVFRKRLYALVLCGLLMLESLYCIKGAVEYAEMGRETKVVLEQVLDNTTEESDILLAFSALEVKRSAGIWLESNGRDNRYIYYSKNTATYDMYDKDAKTYLQDMERPLEAIDFGIDVILCDATNYETVLEELQLSINDYEIASYRYYCIAIKR